MGRGNKSSPARGGAKKRAHAEAHLEKTKRKYRGGIRAARKSEFRHCHWEKEDKISIDRKRGETVVTGEEWDQGKGKQVNHHRRQKKSNRMKCRTRKSQAGRA